MHNTHITKATVQNKFYQTPKLLHLQLSFSEELFYTPGQFCIFKLGQDVYRSYSICSSNGLIYNFVISLVSGGTASNILNRMTIGEELEIVGIFGDFTLEESLGKIFLIATGTGIAPFRAMLQTLKTLKNDIFLLYGVHNDKDVLFYQDFVDFNLSHKNFHFEIQSHPEKGNIINHLPVPNENDSVYICGNPLVVIDVFKRLNPYTKNIKLERFD